MKPLLLAVLLSSCAHAPVRLFCRSAPTCREVSPGTETVAATWACECPWEEEPTPGERMWFVEREE